MSQHRPQQFQEYIGQTTAKKRLEISITAAMKDNRQLRHVLIDGPSGLGKTTIAKIVASQFGRDLVSTTGPSIKNQKSIIGLLKSFGGGFLFIDEIHELKLEIQEFLLVVLEDFEIDEEVTLDGVKTQQKSKVQPFTLIGATTKPNMVDSALRQRFGIKVTLEPYSDDELSTIVRRYISKNGFGAWDDQAIFAISRRSRRTPRLAIDLSEEILDFARCNDMDLITVALVEDYFSSINPIDIHGLTNTDRRYLLPLTEGPLSISRWANKTGEKADVLADVYEPYYNKIDLVRIDSKGRWATEKLYRVLGVKTPGEDYGNQTAQT